MGNKKILIITYYWPPSGGSGVQRWLKFAKYLSRLGWEPCVFTPENPSFTIQDKSLLKDVPDAVEVIKLPIWEPYQLFFKVQRIFGKKEAGHSDLISAGKKSFFQSVSSWIRGNFFIPDARIFWVNPSVAFLTDFVRSNQIDKVITTGPPHSIHLIGLKLKSKIPGLQWIADFRDPWSEWDLLDTLAMTPWAKARHRSLEHAVLSKADKVITIAPYHVNRFRALGKRKVELITNGFDAEDFASIRHVRNEKFIIRHIGIVDELRDPRPVMVTLKAICDAQSELTDNVRVEFIGNVNSAFKSFVTGDAVLSKMTSFVGQVPHDELLNIYGKTDLQLLVLAHSAIAPGNLPGKFFEYLASGNPILAIGPVEGDAAAVLAETKSGVIHEHTDHEGIKTSMLTFYQKWKLGVLTTDRNVSKYSREELTRQLVQLLDAEN